MAIACYLPCTQCTRVGTRVLSRTPHHNIITAYGILNPIFIHPWLNMAILQYRHHAVPGYPGTLCNTRPGTLGDAYCNIEEAIPTQWLATRYRVGSSYCTRVILVHASMVVLLGVVNTGTCVELSWIFNPWHSLTLFSCLVLNTRCTFAMAIWHSVFETHLVRIANTSELRGR